MERNAPGPSRRPIGRRAVSGATRDRRCLFPRRVRHPARSVWIFQSGRFAAIQTGGCVSPWRVQTWCKGAPKPQEGQSSAHQRIMPGATGVTTTRTATARNDSGTTSAVTEKIFVNSLDLPPCGCSGGNHAAWHTPGGLAAWHPPGGPDLPTGRPGIHSDQPGPGGSLGGRRAVAKSAGAETVGCWAL